MTEFPFHLLPERLRTYCQPLRLAVFYGCMWEVWAMHKVEHRRRARRALLQWRREMAEAFQAEGFGPARLHELASAIRRQAVASIERESAGEAARLAARDAANREAFESGSYDRTNVVRLPHRSAD